MMHSQHFYAITEKSQVGEARRRLVDLAEKGGFHTTEMEKVAIVVTELATNLLKHATEGELVARLLDLHGEMVMEILSLDRGPGMANVAECLRDGYSTTGSLGQGLGAIRRLSTYFDLYSTTSSGNSVRTRVGTSAGNNGGTVLLVHLAAQSATRRLPATATGENQASAQPFVYGVICRPKPGETVSGDGWTVHWQPQRGLFLVSDGLGHGPDAGAASQQAIRTFQAQPTRNATSQLESIHAALHGTRGAAIALVDVVASGSPAAEPSVNFIGVGNISGRVLIEENTRHLLSQNGIVGHQMRKIQQFTERWSKDALLVLSSDGLGTRWTFDGYPGLRYRHPSLIAGVLYRDFTRGTDDVTVLVVKEP